MLANGTIHFRCFLNNYRKCKSRAVVYLSNPTLVRPNAVPHTHERESYLEYNVCKDFYLKEVGEFDPSILQEGAIPKRIHNKRNAREDPGPSNLNMHQFSNEEWSRRPPSDMSNINLPQFPSEEWSRKFPNEPGTSLMPHYPHYPGPSPSMNMAQFSNLEWFPADSQEPAIEIKQEKID